MAALSTNLVTGFSGIVGKLFMLMYYRAYNNFLRLSCLYSLYCEFCGVDINKECPDV